MGFWLNTYTGKRFDLDDPRPEDIDIVDIAVALANQCRYAGHTRRHYSVAEHSVIVSQAVAAVTDDRNHHRWGLMHDAAEAYVTDIPWPIKAAGLVPEVVALEKRIMAVICERFDLPDVEPALVKEIDVELLDLEADALLSRHPDWPRGTPRVPRPTTRDSFHGRRRFTNDWSVTFLRAASDLGIADSRDLHRLLGLD